MNRKERRAIQFGTAPAEFYKVEPTQVPTVIKNVGGRIVIPSVENHVDSNGNKLKTWSILPFMIPRKELDDDYATAYHGRRNHNGDTSGLDDRAYRLSLFARFTADAFFRGVSDVKIVLKPEVVCHPNEEGSLSDQFWRYFYAILSSYDPEHNHKMVYCMYMLDMCVSFISWK